jgi:hypothetical protein
LFQWTCRNCIGARRQVAITAYHSKRRTLHGWARAGYPIRFEILIPSGPC